MTDELMELEKHIREALTDDDPKEKIKQYNLIDRLADEFTGPDGFLDANKCSDFSTHTGLRFIPRTIQDLDKQYMAIGIGLDNVGAIEFYRYPH